MKIKVAITQMSCSNNYEANIKKAEEMVKKCAEAFLHKLFIINLSRNTIKKLVLMTIFKRLT